MDALERIGPRERGPREKRIVEVRPPLPSNRDN